MESFFATVVDRWPIGRADYHFHVLFPDTTGRELVDAYRGLTHRQPGLEPVPAEWLHLTLLHSGPADQVTDTERDEIIARVRAACTEVAPFEITLDRPVPGSVAVECAGHPGRPARALWKLVADVIDGVTGSRFARIPSVYYPHVSLGYGVDSFDHRPMKVWLSDNVPPPFSLPVTQITLVAQSHDGRRITWRRVADISLAG